MNNHESSKLAKKLIIYINKYEDIIQEIFDIYFIQYTNKILNKIRNESDEINYEYILYIGEILSDVYNELNTTSNRKSREVLKKIKKKLIKLYKNMSIIHSIN